MAFCPYCMTETDASVCPACHKPTAYTAQPGQLPAGACPDGRGRYRIGAVLGQGGFGITYIGIDNSTKQRVAIKEYFPAQCAQRIGSTVAEQPAKKAAYEGGRRSFLEEGKTLYGVKDIPSVVKVYDCFEANNTAYIVMEYLTGMTLQQKFQRDGVIPLDQLLPRLYTLVNDLAKLHATGIVHRDISPDNVMWMPNGTLKLLDFGSARSTEDGKSMTVMLKHGFAPVEQYMRHGQGPWTDVYALCATVYYCLTGQVVPMSPERLENDTLVPPSRLGVKMTAQQEQALLWGLAVQPKNRPANMEQFGKKFFAVVPPPPPPPPQPTLIERLMKKARDVWEHFSAYSKTRIGGPVVRIVLALLVLVIFILLVCSIF